MSFEKGFDTVTRKAVALKGELDVKIKEKQAEGGGGGDGGGGVFRRYKRADTKSAGLADRRSQERPIDPTIGEMAGRVRKHILQLVGLGHQQADILIIPFGRRHVLDEEQDALKAVLRIHDILGWIRIRIWIRV